MHGIIEGASFKMAALDSLLSSVDMLYFRGLSGTVTKTFHKEKTSVTVQQRKTLFFPVYNPIRSECVMKAGFAVLRH